MSTYFRINLANIQGSRATWKSWKYPGILKPTWKYTGNLIILHNYPGNFIIVKILKKILCFVGHYLHVKIIFRKFLNFVI